MKQNLIKVLAFILCAIWLVGSVSAIGYIFMINEPVVAIFVMIISGMATPTTIKCWKLLNSSKRK